MALKTSLSLLELTINTNIINYYQLIYPEQLKIISTVANNDQRPREIRNWLRYLSVTLTLCVRATFCPVTDFNENYH